MQRLVLLALALILVAGCAKPGIVRETVAPDRIMPVERFKGLDTPTELNASVFYLDAGETFPLNITLENGLVGLGQDHIDLVIKQRIYFRIVLPPDLSDERFEQLKALNRETLAAMSETEKRKLFEGTMVCVSRDAAEWAPLNDPQALQQVLGLDHGTIRFGSAVSAQEGLWFSLIVKTDP